MEIVVTGRNVEVPTHFRVHVTDKVGRLERYDHKMMGMHVELFHEPNRRQLKTCQRVEITGRGGCGTVARAEATAKDFYAALDLAISKLEGRLRRSHDRRRVGGRRSRTVSGRGGATITEELPDLMVEELPTGEFPIPAPRSHDENLNGHHGEGDHDLVEREMHEVEALAAVYNGVGVDDPDPCPGRVVRRKVHTSQPMTVDDALARMELVGHDFYLFSDSDSGEPSVVYRRRGYDYGLIRLGS
ncbi:ribosome hibernation-promoting factor, HPF/YfiA family [Pseudonocardia sp. N23]|uniref:ribosome hibernation-promoting factor, HPF/YfiA family n=1 Tax=Pseudonocardia sp. N23 TaxID=1987376 RepID=UPI000BFB5505|nr:ribosome-associated translation inhibitor RaiA [Pseudonocardia sp. N23]GAY09947.1 ribosomal subunit interface protein [Pseudonocardia sp. N23]